LTGVTLRVTTERDQILSSQRTEASFDDDDLRGVVADHATKLRNILARLDAAAAIEDMDLPGFPLHALKGELRGFWSITVRANWRVIFRFIDVDSHDVDYLDYH
jgi:proteic killer suppression protein